MAKRLFSRRAGAIGLVLYGMSAALVIVTIVAGFYSYAAVRVSIGQSIAAFGVAFCAWALMARLYKLARRATNKIFPSYEAIEQYAAQSGRQLFVFLREFGSDPAPDFRLGFWNSSVSEEEKIANHFQGYGTMVAVGRPGERLPAGGSFRIYIDDDSWQCVVGRLLDRADLILLRCGDRPGLSWELEQIIARNKLEKTLFIPSRWTKNVATVERLRKHVELPISEEDRKVREAQQNLSRMLEQHVLDDEFSRSAQQAIEISEGARKKLDEARLAMSFWVPLVQVKDGRVLPLNAELSEALATVTRGLKLRPTLWRTLKGWSIAAILWAFIAVFVGSLFCGSGLGCYGLDQYFIAADVIFFFTIVFVGFFIIG